MDRSDAFEAIGKATDCVQDILRMLQRAQEHVSASDAFRLRLARAHALSLSDELEALLRSSLSPAGKNSQAASDSAPPPFSTGVCELARCSQQASHDACPAYVQSA